VGGGKKAIPEREELEERGRFRQEKRDNEDFEKKKKKQTEEEEKRLHFQIREGRRGPGGRKEILMSPDLKKRSEKSVRGKFKRRGMECKFRTTTPGREESWSIELRTSSTGLRYPAKRVELWGPTRKHPLVKNVGKNSMEEDGREVKLGSLDQKEYRIAQEEGVLLITANCSS